MSETAGEGQEAFSWFLREVEIELKNPVENLIDPVVLREQRITTFFDASLSDKEREEAARQMAGYLAGSLIRSVRHKKDPDRTLKGFIDQTTLAMENRKKSREFPPQEPPC